MHGYRVGMSGSILQTLALGWRLQTKRSWADTHRRLQVRESRQREEPTLLRAAGPQIRDCRRLRVFLGNSS